MSDASDLQDMLKSSAKFALGQVVRHRVHPFRGVIFDVDPTFNNTDEWWESIPEENRPRKDQPFYHLLAENETTYYVAYVSEQNLVRDDSGEPVDHPEVAEMFGPLRRGRPLRGRGSSALTSSSQARSRPCADRTRRPARRFRVDDDRLGAPERGRRSVRPGGRGRGQRLATAASE